MNRFVDVESQLQPPAESSERTWQFRAANEGQTEQLGCALAAGVEPGTVVALVGELGAGKTRLVQAVAHGLGIDRKDVTSPTFVLVMEHAGKLPLYHFDAYRLRDVDEFLALGADELLNGDGMCLIEWADKVAAALPEDALWIEIVPLSVTEREFRFRATGPVSAAVLRRTAELLSASE